MNEKDTAVTDNAFAAQQAFWMPWMRNVATSSGEQRPEKAVSPIEEQFDELRDTWLASAAKWSEFVRQAGHAELGDPAKLREIFAPASWARFGSKPLEAELRRFLEGPRYALLWDLDRKMMELQQLTVQLDQDVAAYQAVLQKAWNEAVQRFAKLVGAAPDGVRSRTWRSLVDQWLTVANETLTEVYRTEEFLEAQRRALRSASDRHLKEREIAEAWAEAAHLPTRTEVDELQRQVLELRRELRLLRRSARTTPTAGAPSPARRKPATQRSRA